MADPVRLAIAPWATNGFCGDDRIMLGSMPSQASTTRWASTRRRPPGVARSTPLRDSMWSRFATPAATTALLEELVDFFPSGKRQVLSKALAKLKTLENKAIEAASRRLDDPDLDLGMGGGSRSSGH